MGVAGVVAASVAGGLVALLLMATGAFAGYYCYAYRRWRRQTADGRWRATGIGFDVLNAYWQRRSADYGESSVNFASDDQSNTTDL